jgi:DNA polymerase
MKTHPGRALYTYARYWRSVGIKQLAITLPEEEQISPEESLKERQTALDALKPFIDSCQKCQLSNSRTRAVFGEGNPMSSLVFIAGPPDQDCENSNSSLSGEAGELFDRMLNKMGYDREQIYMTSIVKCRPPEDRHPNAEELSTCQPWLEQQLNTIAPTVIVTMGAVATKSLLQLEAPITQLRGKFHHWKDTLVMPTYHPAYLLKKTTARKDVWADMLTVLDQLKATST